MKPTEPTTVPDDSEPQTVQIESPPEPLQTNPPNPKKKNLPPKIPLEKSELVKMFLEMLTTIKLYHWNTHSYARHKATDELYEKLSDLVDEFVEVMQGKMFSPNRIQTINEEIKAITPETKQKMVDKILYYIEQLQNLNHVFSSKKDSDLLNIRDEMIAHLNQFLYLFSFDEI
jgi:DNA-binding ferritin-like protein